MIIPLQYALEAIATPITAGQFLIILIHV